MKSKEEDVEFVVKVPIRHIEATNLETVASDLKATLEREGWRITSLKVK